MKLRCALAFALVAMTVIGCSDGPSKDNSDQVKKVEALKNASKDSMAKDGIKSE